MAWFPKPNSASAARACTNEPFSLKILLRIHPRWPPGANYRRTSRGVAAQIRAGPAPPSAAAYTERRSCPNHARTTRGPRSPRSSIVGAAIAQVRVNAARCVTWWSRLSPLKIPFGSPRVWVRPPPPATFSTSCAFVIALASTRESANCARSVPLRNAVLIMRTAPHHRLSSSFKKLFESMKRTSHLRPSLGGPR